MQQTLHILAVRILLEHPFQMFGCCLEFDWVDGLGHGMFLTL